MKKLLGLILGLIISISSAFAARSCPNLFNGTFDTGHGVQSSNGAETPVEGRKSFYIPVTPGQEYVISRSAVGTSTYWYYATYARQPYTNETAITYKDMGVSALTYTVTVPEGANYLAVYFGEGTSPDVSISLTTCNTTLNSLPSAYQQLEYLESSGTQYIDTGYKKSQVTDVNARLSVVRFSGTFQILYGLSNDVQCAINSTGQWLNYGGTASTSASLNVWYNTKLDYTNRNLYIDGTPVATGNAGSNSGNILVFNNTTYKSYIRVSSVEIHDLNGNIVASFVPARRVSDGVLGMYDLADSNSATAFHTNAGTDTFIAGPTIIPSTFEKLQYIESDGTQYIDTGIVPTVDMNFSITFERSENGWIMGSVGSAGNTNDFGISKTAIRFGTKYVSTGLDFSSKSTVTMNKSGYSVDGTATSWNETAAMNMSSVGSFYLFWARRSSATKGGKIYSFSISDTNGDVMNLVPVKTVVNGQTVVGMFDTVTGNFLTNSGTGDFVAGPSAGIKIATTKYNAARFDPLVTTLNTAIAKIKDVVSTTIEQTKAVASLQANKQRRPNDNEECPAGKKCLLVEDSNGTPHWYEIVESYYNPTLPAGFTELAYLQGDGNAYIDTNVVPVATDKISLEVEFASLPSSGGKTILGARDAAAVGGGINFAVSSSGQSMDFFGTRYSVAGTTELNKVYKYEVVSKVGTIYKNGVALGSNTFPTDGSLSLPILVFGLNNGGTKTASSDISAKIRRVIVEGKMDLVPARRESDGVLGMYDLANNQFHTNAGTGTFTAGPVVLPAGFTTLQYIQSDGTQYINTGINTGSSATEVKIVTDLTFTGIHTTESSVSLNYSTPGSPGVQVYIYKGGQSLYNQGVSFTVSENVDYLIETISTATTRSLKLNGEIKSQQYSRPIINQDIQSFGTSGYPGVEAKIRSHKIYINSVLTRDFVPAKQGNTVGMFDLVTGDFFQSATGTAFTAGPVAQ